MELRRAIAACLILTMLTACATVADGTTQKVKVASRPDGATVSIDCGDAAHHPGITTPAVVVLPRRADPCRILLTKDGYEPFSISLRREWSPRAGSNFSAVGVGLDVMDDACCDDGWFFWAALVTATTAAIGGVGLGVDRATGALYQHVPEQIDVTLQQSPADDER